MTPRMLGSLAGVLLVVGSSTVAAQPLADVARQEKLRRAALAAQTVAGDAPKTYTAADLRGGGRLTTGSAAPSREEAPADEPSAAEATDDAAAAPDEDAALDEDAWRDRMTAARESRQRLELLADALQNRVDSLWADFTSRDDPAQRAVLEQNRQAAIDELAATREQIDALTQELADIRTEGRRANIPAGWLR